MNCTHYSLTLIVAGFAWAIASATEEPPAWAYPVDQPTTQPAADDGKPRRVPGSAVSFTQREIVAIAVQPPDWHPGEHPVMPGIVGHSRERQVFACAYCHLPNGAGRPENASLAGLSAGYIKAQIAEFRDGNRAGSEPKRTPQTLMIALARELTDAEVEEAAAYFSALAPVSFTRVVEARTVPRTVEAGWILRKAPGTATEPLGTRIVEVAQDFERFERRDSRTPFVAYVPRGSIARGADLVASGGDGRTQPCAICHGPGLKGLADVPPIAGRSPTFLYRQMYDLRNGSRQGTSAAPMKPVVARLTDADMVAIAAYVASRRP